MIAGTKEIDFKILITYLKKSYTLLLKNILHKSQTIIREKRS